MCNKNTGLNIMTVLAMVCLFILGGCATKPDESLAVKLGKLGDPDLSDMIRKNFDALGGRDLFETPINLKIDAIASVYSDSGGKVLMKQTHEIGFSNKKITITSQDAGIDVIESMESGSMAVITQKQGNATTRISENEEIYGSMVKLTLELYALTGAYGLLDDNINLRYQGEERKGGKIYRKVQADGFFIKQRGKKDLGIKDSLLLWYDADTSLLDRIIIRYLDPIDGQTFKFLTVNVRNYETLDNGLVIPVYLGYVPGDEFQNFSEKYLMSIELLKVQLLEQ